MSEQRMPEPHPGRWRILAVTMAVVFVALLDVSIVNVGLPSMQRGLAASAGTIQWVVSGYALTFGLLLVTGGRLGDARGRRPLMLVGLSGFIAASAACGLAPNATTLVAARLVQGACGGLLLPQNAGIIQTYFAGKERGTAFGMMGFTVGVSSAIGPVLGGLIIAVAGATSGWRWLFLVNVPIGLALLVAIWLIIPHERRDGERADLDIVGAILLGVTVVAVIYPVTTLETGASWQLAILLAAPVLVAATTWWERRCPGRGRTPILDIGLLQHTPGYVGGLLVGALYFTGFTGILLVYSLYLQAGLGYPALTTGLLIAPFALANAVSAPIAGRLVPRLRRTTTILALGIMLTGMVASAVFVPLAPDPVLRGWALATTLLLTGLGAGGVVSPNLTLALENVPTRMAGAAGAALQTGQRIGGALGSALMLMIYEVTVGHQQSPGTALRTVLAASWLIIAVALALAILDRRHDRAARAG